MNKRFTEHFDIRENSISPSTKRVWKSFAMALQKQRWFGEIYIVSIESNYHVNARITHKDKSFTVSKEIMFDDPDAVARHAIKVFESPD
jgi:hypothetical protein